MSDFPPGFTRVRRHGGRPSCLLPSVPRNRDLRPQRRVSPATPLRRHTLSRGVRILHVAHPLQLVDIWAVASSLVTWPLLPQTHVEGPFGDTRLPAPQDPSGRNGRSGRVAAVCFTSRRTGTASPVRAPVPSSRQRRVSVQLRRVQHQCGCCWASRVGMGVGGSLRPHCAAPGDSRC